jgi:hypothetical protein
MTVPRTSTTSPARLQPAGSLSIWGAARRRNNHRQRLRLRLLQNRGADSRIRLSNPVAVPYLQCRHRTPIPTSLSGYNIGGRYSCFLHCRGAIWDATIGYLLPKWGAGTHTTNELDRIDFFDGCSRSKFDGACILGDSNCIFFRAPPTPPTPVLFSSYTRSYSPTSSTRRLPKTPGHASNTSGVTWDFSYTFLYIWGASPAKFPGISATRISTCNDTDLRCGSSSLDSIATTSGHAPVTLQSQFLLSPALFSRASSTARFRRHTTMGSKAFSVPYMHISTLHFPLSFNFPFFFFRDFTSKISGEYECTHEL